MRVVIVGAGGHGQVVADALIAAANDGSTWEPVGYVDDNPALVGCRLLGLPVLGLIDSLAQLPHDAVVVAIGDNESRRSVFNLLDRRGERFVIARHPSAVIAASVEVGTGTMICAGVIVNASTTIGSNVILNTGCTIDHHSRIADHVHIGPGVCSGGTVTVKTAALVGIGATVMPGRTIGAGSVVGAGALVQRDVADATVVVGVPARPIRAAVLSKSRPA
jgi:sugar O-acyltransferase (sialic acid O-acetyltransferase NeuD family)